MIYDVTSKDINKSESFMALESEIITLVKTKDETNTLKVKMFPLAPNSDYMISIQYHPELVVKNLKEINDGIFLAQPGSNESAKYQAMLDSSTAYNTKSLEMFEQSFTSQLEYPLITFDEYTAYFKTELSSDYSELSKSLKNNDALDKDLIELQDTLKSCPLCRFLMTCNCKDQPVGEEMKTEFTTSLLVGCKFEKCTQSSMVGVANAQVDLISVLSHEPPPKSPPTLEEMYKNVVQDLAAIQSIRRLLNQSSLVTMVSDSCRNHLSKILESIISKLKTRKENADKIWATINLKLTRLNQNGMTIGDESKIYAFVTFFNLDSKVADIKTDAGNYIIPEFGLATMFSNQTTKPTLFARPYFGVNISFRPINKNVRFSELKYLHVKKTKDSNGKVTRTLEVTSKSIWHHLSFTLGVTKYSIATNHAEIDDLINGTCLMSGLNYRIGRSLRVGSGVTWYKKNNSNPLLPKEITAMPYVSLSLDLDIVDLFSKITDALVK